MSDLVGHLLTDVYVNWLQFWKKFRIYHPVRWEEMMLIGKDPSKGDIKNNFRSMTLQNTQLKILAKRWQNSWRMSWRRKLVLSRAGQFTIISVLYASPQRGPGKFLVKVGH